MCPDEPSCYGQKKSLAIKEKLMLRMCAIFFLSQEFYHVKLLYF